MALHRERSPWIQIVFLTVLSGSAVAPQLSRRGLDVVTRTYTEGAQRLSQGSSPYAPPSEGRDVFKYSPAFAWMYRPLTMLPPVIHALAWSFLNAFLFWWGLSVWWKGSRATRWSDGVALVVAAMELDISLRYQQVNALIAGSLLLALHAYRQGFLKRAAWGMSLVSNWKILPLIFWSGLGLPIRWNFLGASVLSGCLWFALPALSLGWGWNWEVHKNWFSLLQLDVGAPGLLDLQSVGARLGWGEWGSWLRGLVGVVGLGAFFGLRWRFKNQPAEQFPWSVWYALGMSTLLLVSPRTESPTFVFLAPAFVLLAWELTENIYWLIPLGISMLSITVCYTDLWPRWLWDPRATSYASKTLGTLLFWGIAMGLSLKAVRRSPVRE